MSSYNPNSSSSLTQRPIGSAHYSSRYRGLNLGNKSSTNSASGGMTIDGLYPSLHPRPPTGGNTRSSGGSVSHPYSSTSSSQPQPQQQSSMQFFTVGGGNVSSSASSSLPQSMGVQGGKPNHQHNSYSSIIAPPSLVTTTTTANSSSTAQQQSVNNTNSVGQLLGHSIAPTTTTNATNTSSSNVNVVSLLQGEYVYSASSQQGTTTTNNNRNSGGQQQVVVKNNKNYSASTSKSQQPPQPSITQGGPPPPPPSSGSSSGAGYRLDLSSLLANIEYPSSSNAPHSSGFLYPQPEPHVVGQHRKGGNYSSVVSSSARQTSTVNSDNQLTDSTGRSSSKNIPKQGTSSNNTTTPPSSASGLVFRTKAQQPQSHSGGGNSYHYNYETSQESGDIGGVPTENVAHPLPHHYPTSSQNYNSDKASPSSLIPTELLKEQQRQVLHDYQQGAQQDQQQHISAKGLIMTSNQFVPSSSSVTQQGGTASTMNANNNAGSNKHKSRVLTSGSYKAKSLRRSWNGKMDDHNENAATSSSETGIGALSGCDQFQSEKVNISPEEFVVKKSTKETTMPPPSSTHHCYSKNDVAVKKTTEEDQEDEDDYEEAEELSEQVPSNRPFQQQQATSTTHNSNASSEIIASGGSNKKAGAETASKYNFHPEGGGDNDHGSNLLSSTSGKLLAQKTNTSSSANYPPPPTTAPHSARGERSTDGNNNPNSSITTTAMKKDRTPLTSRLPSNYTQQQQLMQQLIQQQYQSHSNMNPEEEAPSCAEKAPQNTQSTTTSAKGGSTSGVNASQQSATAWGVAPPTTVKNPLLYPGGTATSSPSAIHPSGGTSKPNKSESAVAAFSAQQDPQRPGMDTLVQDVMAAVSQGQPYTQGQYIMTGGATIPDQELQAPSQSQPPKIGMGKAIQPSLALQYFDAHFTKHEKKEITDYDAIYFVAPHAAKIAAPVPSSANFGYDDDKGDYIVVKADHIAYRYEVLGELGKGSFGQVLKVFDHKHCRDVALKIIRNKKRFHQQATVEIRILDHLRTRDPDERSCTVRMLNYFLFRNHTVLTFELHSMNLYELTKLNRYQPFAPALIKRFTAQLLVAMSFLWREHIVHCDMKPENILLRYENKTSVKLIDFGSSCFENERMYTYIQSRFYRAPEIILGLSYGRPIDLWSLGCIICEMALGYPIFPGENETEQLACIMEYLGVPHTKMIDKSPKRKQFFDSLGAPRLIANSRNKVRRPSTKDFQTVLKTDDVSFIDFIMQFLRWDPYERVTPNEAMQHPWIADCFHQETVDPSATAHAPASRNLYSAQPGTRSSQRVILTTGGGSGTMSKDSNGAPGTTSGNPTTANQSSVGGGNASSNVTTGTTTGGSGGPSQFLRKGSANVIMTARNSSASYRHGHQRLGSAAQQRTTTTQGGGQQTTSSSQGVPLSAKNLPQLGQYTTTSSGALTARQQSASGARHLPPPHMYSSVK